MFDFGYKIIPSLALVDNVHIGTELNGYRGSPHRSKRLIKKLTRGTKQRRYRDRITTPLMEQVPRGEALIIGNTMYMHPAFIEQMKQEEPRP